MVIQLNTAMKLRDPNLRPEQSKGIRPFLEGHDVFVWAAGCLFAYIMAGKGCYLNQSGFFFLLLRGQRCRASQH